MKDIYLCLMLRLTTHIERLLLGQDCILVPGLGGFVLQTANAAYNPDEETFLPSQKEIVFNTTLQHNDGLLCESYMQSYHVDYREAQRMLEEDVRNIREMLYANGEVSLGFIGHFRLGSEGQIIFVPNAADILSVYSYGFTSFRMPALATLEAEERQAFIQEEKVREKDVFYIPVSRRLIRTVAASVAAVSLFLLISTPVKEVNPAAYKASFVPTEIVSYSSVPAAEPQPVRSEAPVMAVEEARPALAEKNVEEAPEPKKAEIPQAPSKRYYLVIASLPSEAQAKDFMETVDRQKYGNADIVLRGNKYRVYADSFDNRADAESYLVSLRKDKRYQDAWLFIN